MRRANLIKGWLFFKLFRKISFSDSPIKTLLSKYLKLLPIKQQRQQGFSTLAPLNP